MTLRPPTLTNQDHNNMNAFLDQVLEDFKAGMIAKKEAIDGLTHVIAAIDCGNYGEASNWFKQGRALIRSGR
jgi:hypothetical protein